MFLQDLAWICISWLNLSSLAAASLEMFPFLSCFEMNVVSFMHEIRLNNIEYKSRSEFKVQKTLNYSQLHDSILHQNTSKSISNILPATFGDKPFSDIILTITNKCPQS